jgi:hypothetical protein
VTSVERGMGFKGFVHYLIMFSPRNSSITIRIFSSATYWRLVLRRSF